MHIGICDDEIAELQSLKRMIESYCDAHGLEAEIHLFASGVELLSESEHLDLLFLDIAMPGVDGIEAGRRFRKRNPRCKIAMETCREDRIREAFYLEAYRFLPKPMREADVWEALEGFEESRAGYRRISLWEMRQKVEVRQREIVYIQTYDSYTEYIVGNRLMRSERSLHDLEKELDPKLFFRVNKKYIVNFSYIEGYDNGILTIRDTPMTVSRRKKKDFEKKYRDYDLYFR